MNFQKRIGSVGLRARYKPLAPPRSSDWSEGAKSLDPRIAGLHSFAPKFVLFQETLLWISVLQHASDSYFCRPAFGVAAEIEPARWHW